MLNYQCRDNKHNSTEIICIDGDKERLVCIVYCPYNAESLKNAFNVGIDNAQ